VDYHPAGKQRVKRRLPMDSVPAPGPISAIRDSMPMVDTSPPSAKPFEILAPARWTAPAVFNSPHSGSRYGPEFLRQSRLSPLALRRSEDCYVDELFMCCLDHGAPLLRAHVPRAYVDLNREPYELDPRMFAGPLPGYVNSASPRVAGGLGTIPRLVAEGEEIYREKLTFAEAQARIDTIYLPYHRTLAALLSQVARQGQPVLLLDCHSMPSSAMAHIPGATCADVVLGDRHGAACDPAISDLAEAGFRAEGFSVLRNKPYAGGFITQNHGAPVQARHALQIELNRGLYMNEVTLEKTPRFGTLQHSLARVVARLLTSLPQLLQPIPLAAE
jgi:N-formylglutamate amidohydrolase